MNRFVLTLDLRDDPGAIATYQEYHQHVWPEVLASLRNAGIREMEIFLLERRLVMIVETDGRDLRQSFALHHDSHPRVIEWETLMKSLQVPPPGAAAGELWTAMTRVFQCDFTQGAPATAEASERR
jgi:L-rhamnose mutarotase